MVLHRDEVRASENQLVARVERRARHRIQLPLQLAHLGGGEVEGAVRGWSARPCSHRHACLLQLELRERMQPRHRLVRARVLLERRRSRRRGWRHMLAQEWSLLSVRAWGSEKVWLRMPIALLLLCRGLGCGSVMR